jgi:hypothetical protein
MGHPFPPDWTAIHSQTYVYEPGCWEACKGFCCSGRHEDFSFQLLPSRGAAIFYMQEEYEHLAGQGRAPKLDGVATRQVSIEFGGPRPLSFVYHFCGLEGACQGVLDKPFHCLVYPFMPVFDNYGALLDVAPGSIFDLTAILHDEQASCPLWKTRKEHYLRLWRSRTPLLAPLRRPLVLFYLAAYKLFVDSYNERFLDWEEGRELRGAEFWSAWELQYLGRRFFDSDLLKQGFLTKLHELEKIHGSFF